MQSAVPHSKQEIWLSQKRRVYASLFKEPQTRLQVAKSTDTPLQNVCRYIADFRKSGSVFITKVDRCSISKMKAEFITTNPVFFNHGQMKLFSEC